MRTRFTLDQLETLLAVVECGSFSAAGRRLHRVQSAVSYTIQQLEHALGTELFDRSRRTPVLTDAGRRLVAEAELVVAQAHELSDIAASLTAGIEPRLDLVVESIYPQQHLVQVLAGFAERFGATNVRVETALLGDVLARLEDGPAQLGVCNLAGGDVPAGLRAVHLGEVVLVPVCAPEHPLASVDAPQALSELESHHQIVHTEREPARTEDQGVLGSRTWRVTDLRLKHAAITGGIGWGSLPLSLAQTDLERGRLHRLHPEPWPSEGHRLGLHAVWRRDRSLGPAASWLRDALRLP